MCSVSLCAALCLVVLFSGFESSVQGVDVLDNHCDPQLSVWKRKGGRKWHSVDLKEERAGEEPTAAEVQASLGQPLRVVCSCSSRASNRSRQQRPGPSFRPYWSGPGGAGLAHGLGPSGPLVWYRSGGGAAVLRVRRSAPCGGLEGTYTCHLDRATSVGLDIRWQGCSAAGNQTASEGQAASVSPSVGHRATQQSSATTSDPGGENDDDDGGDGDGGDETKTSTDGDDDGDGDDGDETKTSTDGDDDGDDDGGDETKTSTDGDDDGDDGDETKTSTDGDGPAPPTVLTPRRPPIAQIPRIIPHLSGRGVTLFLVRGTGQGRGIKLLFSPAHSNLSTLEHVVFGNPPVVTVYGMLPGNHYRVEQVVQTDSTEGTVVGEGEFNTPVTAPSGPVQDLTVTEATNTSVALSWSPPAPASLNHPGGITGYLVEARPVLSNHCTPRVVASARTGLTSAVLVRLSPRSRYCILVYPQTAAGQAGLRVALSGQVRALTTAPSPHSHPTITLFQAQFKAVAIAWQHPSDVEGTIEEYIIQYRQADEGEEWSELREPGYSLFKTVIGVFQSGGHYQVRMALSTSGGTGPYSPPVDVLALPPVHDVAVCALGGGRLLVEWSVRPRQGLGAELEGVVLSLRSPVNVTDHQEVFTEAGRGRALVRTGRQGLSTLTASLHFKTQLFFVEDHLDLVPLGEAAYCPPSMPLSLAVTSVTANSFQLTWAEPEVQGAGLRYEVVVESERFGGQELKTEDSHVVVGGVEEGEEYEVLVFAVNLGGRGPSAKTRVVTKETVPNGPVRNLDAYASSATSVMATWEDPEERFVNAAGGITIYKVVVGLSCKPDGIDITFVTVERSETIRDLLPSTWYCIHVLPGNIVGFPQVDSPVVASAWVQLPSEKVLRPPSDGHEDPVVDRHPFNTGGVRPGQTGSVRR